MSAAIFDGIFRKEGVFLRMEEVGGPVVRPGYWLPRVIACGVYRADLHHLTLI